MKQSNIALPKQSKFDETGNACVYVFVNTAIVIIAGLSMSNFDACYQSCMWGHLHAKHSIVRAFLGTLMWIFDKAGVSDKSST